MLSRIFPATKEKVVQVHLVISVCSWIGSHLLYLSKIHMQSPQSSQIWFLDQFRFWFVYDNAEM